MKFFSPTSVLKELLLLQHIEKKPDTTQKEIAQVISGAPSMVNVYIENLEGKGYLIRDYQSAKIVYYNITPAGIKRMNYLLITYMRELLHLYYMAKENIEKFIMDLANKGYKNLLLYGAGEVAETIIGVIRGTEEPLINVIAVIDDDKQKQGKSLLGYRIVSPEKINTYDHDAIVITSYTFEEAIMNRLKDMKYDISKVKRFFGIGRDTSNSDDEYEICIICKCKTDVKKDKPIEERYSYIHGAGQLCYTCYKKLYG